MEGQFLGQPRTLPAVNTFPNQFAKGTNQGVVMRMEIAP